MKTTRRSRALARALFSALLLASAPLATAPKLWAQDNLELGKMWTFENPPLDYLQKTYGFRPSQEWLDAVRLASLRLDTGCSASFVSPQGLIMTNHHCVRDAIGKLSPAGQDWVKNGFYAKAMEDEVKIQGLRIRQLRGMQDITAGLNEGIDEAAIAAAAGDEQQAQQVSRKRQSNLQKVLRRVREEQPELQHDPVALYNGAVIMLYSYKVYDDIRLVCAPHLQTAHFGGDPDNFTYPRWGIDFSFLRAYEDDQPADSKESYFRWSKLGPKEGELTFVTGNPGNTNRLKTLAQLQQMRDATYPIVLGTIDDRIAALEEYAKLGKAQEQDVQTEILSQQNAQKAYRGYLGGLQDEGLMAHKAQAEAAFKSKIEADPEAKAKYGSAWNELEQIAKEQTALEPLFRFQTPSFTTRGPAYSKQLEQAVLLVRATHPEVEEATRKRARQQALAYSIVESEKEKVILPRMFVSHLTRAQKWLPPGDAFLDTLLKGRDPATVDKHLRENSKVNDKEFVKHLLDSGWEDVAAVDDAAIQAAIVLVPMMQANARAMQELQQKEAAHAARIGRALFAAYGTKVSPDATFTLRFSDGLVEGYPCNGTIAPWRTSFYSLYGRNAEFDNHHPFDLPAPWLERRDQVDMTKSVDFVSKNDIIGGNSGSPVINKEREVIGLIFDGNIEMLPNNFLYRDDVPRAVSVHVHAIMESLRKIYDADALADELESGKAMPKSEEAAAGRR